VAEFPSRTPKRLAPEALYEYALKALSRRPCSEKELRERLTRRAADPQDVQPAIERLRQVGYLDDARTAESHAYFKKELEGLGRRRVLSELQRRGIDSQTAERTVNEAYRDSDELELIRQYLKRRLGSRLEGPLEDPKELARLYRGLLRAGFSSGRIGEALRKISADSEWVDGLEDGWSESAE
jgi:regulatory protein